VIQSSTNSTERRRDRKIGLDCLVPLSFEVLFARTDRDLPQVGKARFETYNHHHSHFDGFTPPSVETKDLQKGSFLIYAKDKSTGVVLGSIRIQSNIKRPLDIELHQPNPLPANFIGKHLAFMSRFSVVKSDVAIAVHDALLKAAMMYCDSIQSSHWVVTADVATARLYQKIGFSRSTQGEPYEGAKDAPFPIYLLTATKNDFTKAILEKNKRLHFFIFDSVHPDIRLYDSIAGMWETPRATSPNATPQK
jgi:hypothetical protein